MVCFRACADARPEQRRCRHGHIARQQLQRGDPGCPSYIGPGDIVPGATFWHGLRAYNATYATGSNNALNVRRASDNATANIVILSNGNLDVATAATFAGTDATCTSGSASNSTTLALTGCSSTPTKGDSVLGTVATGSLVQPAYIESVGSFTGGAGNVVLNVKQTVTLSSVTLQVGLYVTELYDQTGNGYSPTQSTAAQQPKLQLSCLNNLPCIVDDPGLGYGYLFLTSPTLTSSQPISLSTMALEKVVQASAFLAPYNYPLGSGIAFDSTAPALVSSNGSTSTYLDSGTATVANTWYLLEAVLTTSPNAVIAVNGVSTTGNAGSGDVVHRSPERISIKRRLSNPRWFLDRRRCMGRRGFLQHADNEPLSQSIYLLGHQHVMLKFSIAASMIVRFAPIYPQFRN